MPAYRFDISGLVKEGDNAIVIEVSTTLERAAAKNRAMMEKLMQNKVLAPIILGEYQKGLILCKLLHIIKSKESKEYQVAMKG